MKISIIIPAYNCERYIERCLDSILPQTGAQLDIIVINDGSEDATGGILEKYKDRIRIKTTSNMGSAAAKNEGIGMIDGDYTMFVDSDDYLCEGTIERLAAVLRETEADVVRFRYRLVFPNGEEKCPHNQFGEYEVIEKKDFKSKIYPHFIRGIDLNSVCVVICRSSLIKGRRFRTDMPVAEDAVFSLGTYTQANKTVMIPDVLYNYYQTGEGLTGNGTSVWQKYRCNFIFAGETMKCLKKWDMDSILTRVKVCMRPFFLTFDKIGRVMDVKIRKRR